MISLDFFSTFPSRNEVLNLSALPNRVKEIVEGGEVVTYRGRAYALSVTIIKSTHIGGFAEIMSSDNEPIVIKVINPAVYDSNIVSYEIRSNGTDGLTKLPPVPQS